MNPPMVRVTLTDEQKLKLKPIFDAVTNAHNESTNKRDLHGAVHGQAFEREGGYAEFRFFGREQTEIVKTAILAAIEIDKRKEMQARLIEIKSRLASLTKEQNEINASLAKTHRATNMGKPNKKS